MSNAIILAAKAAAEADVRAASDALKQFPRGPMGLTPDHVKFSPEFRAAKRRYDAAFARLRAVNSVALRAAREGLAMKFIAYRRVSTARQGASGLGLEAQAAAIAEHVRRNGAVVAAEFTEIESGRRADRPELAKALAACRAMRATLLVAKLDRLARNVEFLSALMNSGVDFVAIDNANANRLTLHILAAVAEDEAMRISERTRAALAAAKARGVVLGNPRGAEALHRAGKGNAASIAAARERADRFARDVAGAIDELQAAGARTLAALATGLNERGILSARGGRWHPETVRAALARVKVAP